jgi:integrase
MPKVVTQLNDTQIKNAKPKEKDYQLTDGQGLFLLVKTDSSKWWRFGYVSPTDKKRKQLSFGDYPTVSLADARRLREESKQKVAKGIDPSDERKEDKQNAKQSSYTFEAVTKEFIAKKIKEGKSPTYIDSIRGKLAKHIPTAIHKKQMSEIKRTEIMEAMKIADKVSPHSAKDTLQYAKAIFTYAENMGYLEFSVIASVQARNVLSKIESKNFKHITDPKRFGELLTAIDSYQGEFITRQLLRFTPLVMTRPTEAREAKWSEIDFDAEVWTIPADRMKMRNEHTIPLSKQAIHILKETQPYTGHRELVFASPIRNAVKMSENTVTSAIKRLGFGDEQTAHGFRHSASTMLHENIAEHGSHSLVIEACLAHKDSNQIRAVYNKAEYIAERRKLMQWWADYLDTIKTGG